MHSGSRAGKLTTSRRLFQTSSAVIRRLILSCRPARILRASAACREAMVPTIGPITPAVSQVGEKPAGGELSNTHRRHAVSPGRMGKVNPYEPTHAPYTQGVPVLTE